MQKPKQCIQRYQVNKLNKIHFQYWKMPKKIKIYLRTYLLMTGEVLDDSKRPGQLKLIGIGMISV